MTYLSSAWRSAMTHKPRHWRAFPDKNPLNGSPILDFQFRGTSKNPVILANAGIHFFNPLICIEKMDSRVREDDNNLRVVEVPFGEAHETQRPR